MTDPTKKLCEILEIEQLDRYLFRSSVASSQLPHVFGGQVLAQALNAAIRTVPEEREIHSLHAYFLRPGNIHQPIIYDVDPIRDGGSFTTRRVVAKQDGRAIFSAALSFQVPERGFEHNRAMPEVPAAGSLKSDSDILAQLQTSNPDVELPPRIDVYGAFEKRTNGPLPFLREKSPDPVQGYWVKTVEKVSGPERLHQVLLAYISDERLMGSAMIPHGLHFHDEDLQAASLDHAMWFHAPVRIDEWLYYDLESPVASGGRGLNYGRFYDTRGRLVASTVQEGLMRRR